MERLKAGDKIRFQKENISNVIYYRMEGLQILPPDDWEDEVEEVPNNSSVKMKNWFWGINEDGSEMLIGKHNFIKV